MLLLCTGEGIKTEVWGLDVRIKTEVWGWVEVRDKNKKLGKVG